ncbi:hypothetical protein SNOG_07626 [Parastagonospora nodorum SN15]|uniref:Amine oxidase domain-containing protein n=1 Tax=Phaeosphaeria nodorum (strain SN15 / ATCC MYA-4574 / FGSC 10173) TaxID=321614 RepID=Q0UKT8_PHANO|nr:hypothetical protein SNOG_07626 [Parastagonospora nodorum SN15]EAT85092.2 hypothetical protein SNOG_07626 [Parastagonospora nodorum SN15]
MEKKRIAIVGSGVSGLSALWTLRNSHHDIHLFEAADRLGGHTNTAVWTHKGKSTPVDTGFIVLNTATYPNFIEFLKALDVKTIASQMTFGISRDAGAFEWSGTSGSALFAQSENAFKPSFWRMIFDIVRFNQFALDLLSVAPGSPSTSITAETSIGEYLKQEGYSEAFRDDYLIPMTACVWSTGADKKNGRVQLELDGEGAGKPEIFDEVVLACHGDQAREILRSSATLDEENILAAFETSPNTAYLHSDLSLMPERRAAWSAWNYLTTSKSSAQSQKPSASEPSGALQTVSLTYNMNILQDIPVSEFSDVLVTLNPEVPPSPSTTQAVFEYRHPLYNARMIAAQNQLERIQGKRGVWYAGAWTGYGFHEDGFSSGMNVGLRLGGNVPWAVKDAKFSRGVSPVLGWKDHLARTIIAMLQILVSLFERLFAASEKSRGTTAHKGNGLSNGVEALKKKA